MALPITELKIHRNYSSHVSKTGDIRALVLTEESGIAKGIRRIIAVTGHEAAEARRVGDGLKSKLDHIESLKGKDKDAGLKAFTVVRVTMRIVSTMSLMCYTLLHM